MKIFRIIFYSILPVLAVGNVQAEKPAVDVQQIIRERTGKQVKLPGDGSDTQDVVRAMLDRTLTAETAVKIALLNNRSLRAELEDVGISQADLREAGLLKNPEFAGSARFPDRPPLLADLEGAVTQQVLDILMLPLRKRIAAAQLEQARLHAADEVLDLVASTRMAFYELQAQMQLLAGMKLILDTHQAAVELAQKQHEAGNISDLELANRQATYSEARLESAMVESDIRAKREQLNRLMGLWGADTDWKAAKELPPVPGDDFSAHGLESLAVSHRLDLAAAQAHLAGVVQALGLTKTYRFIGALDIGVDSERNPDGSVVTGPTLRVELPIFNQGQAKMAKGEAELRQAERRYEALAIDIRSEVREKRDQLTASAGVVKFYHDELIPGRKQIVNLTQQQYNGMLVGVYDLLAARQNELNAERGCIEATRDYWIARAGLEQAVGGNLSATQPASAKSNSKQNR